MYVLVMFAMVFEDEYIDMRGSALDRIELTYHDVMVFAIPEFKSLEVLEKKIFALILLSINPKIKPHPNPDPNYKEKNLEKKTLTQKYKTVIAGIRTQTAAWKSCILL